MSLFRTYFTARVLGLKPTGGRPVCVRSGRDPQSARPEVLISATSVGIEKIEHD